MIQRTLVRMFLHTLFFICFTLVLADMSTGRIRGDDEPHMVSWRVLEGVTEPFDSYQQNDIPAWKLMKNSAGTVIVI